MRMNGQGDDERTAALLGSFARTSSAGSGRYGHDMALMMSANSSRGVRGDACAEPLGVLFAGGFRSWSASGRGEPQGLRPAGGVALPDLAALACSSMSRMDDCSGQKECAGAEFVCVVVCVCLGACVRVCVWVWVCVLGIIYEGQGRLKSSTLWDGLSEGVMGQGLATPASPAPRPPLSRRDGRTEAPGSGIFPLCPPMAPTRAPGAPCGRRVGARPLRGHLLIVAPPPPL